MHRIVAFLACAFALPGMATAAGVRSGSLRADVAEAPFALTFTDAAGAVVLASAPAAAPGSPAALSVRTSDGWIHATAVVTVRKDRGGLRYVLGTDDPQDRPIELQVHRAGEGIVELEATFGGDDIVAWGAAFVAAPDERFFGLGERSDATEHRGARVESYVSDGPWITADRPLIA